MRSAIALLVIAATALGGCVVRTRTGHYDQRSAHRDDERHCHDRGGKHHKQVCHAHPHGPGHH